MKYIGDISSRDAALLEFFASKSSRILEFGMGASTQVIAQALQPGAHLFSVETEPSWIARTAGNLAALGVDPAVYTLLPYTDWLSAVPQMVDMIFVDGVDNLRPVFGRSAWHLLSVGGIIMYHDTRRVNDLRTCIELLMEHHNEIGDTFINLDGSNLSGFQRKHPEPYRDWNVDEDRAAWQTGAVEPPANWVSLLD